MDLRKFSLRAPGMRPRAGRMSGALSVALLLSLLLSLLQGGPPAAPAEVVRPELRCQDEPYEYLYEYQGGQGSIRLGDGTTARDFSLESAELDVEYRRPHKELPEDRMILHIKFQDTTTAVRAELRFNADAQAPGYEARAQDPSAEGATDLPVGAIHRENSGLYIFRYLGVPRYELDVQHECGMISRIRLRFEEPRANRFADWLNADYKTLHGAELDLRFRATGYILSRPARSRLQPADVRALPPAPEVQNVPAEIQTGVFRDPQTYLPRLVRRLTQNAGDDLIKLKNLNDWIATHIPYDMDCFRDGENQCDTSAHGVLKAGFTLCAGYTALFREMAGLAGIDALHLVGWSAGGGSLGDELGRHAWNAVRVNDRWYILDVTHNATGRAKGGTITPGPARTSYLFMEPEIAALKLHPDKPLFQFINQPVSFETFKAKVDQARSISNISHRMFDYGLRLASPLPSTFRPGAGGPERLRFHAPTNAELHLSFPQYASDQQEAGAVHFQREGEFIDLFLFAPQKRAPYPLFVNARRGPEDRYQTVAMLWVHPVESGSRAPETFWDFRKRNVAILSPLERRPAPGQTTDFRFRIPGAAEAFFVSKAADDGGRRIALKQSAEDDSIFEARDFALPAGEWELHARFPPERFTRALVRYAPR